MTANLVSAQELCKQYGHVLLSPTRGYVLDTKHGKKNVIIATADWNNGQYQLNATNDDAEFARSARTQVHRHRSETKTNPHLPTSTQLSPPLQSHPAPARVNYQSECTVTPITARAKCPRLPESYPHHQPSAEKTAAFHEWHLKFNHIDLKTLQKMAKLQLLPLPSLLKQPPPKLTCTGCADGKARPKPFKRTEHTYAIGISISSDICGPISPASTHGNKYFVTFIDTKSRYAILHFTATRKDVLTFLKVTIKLIYNLHGILPHVFTSDNAREYISQQATSYLHSLGITPRPTTPYCPQQNGIAERFNATLMQAARATLFHSKLPPHYWEDAVRDAVFKYNISLHSSTKQLPFTLWFGSPPNISHLFAFGQQGTVPIITDKTKQRKLSPRSFPARYMFAVDTSHIMVLNNKSRQYKQVRACDFHPYHPSTDPVHTYAKAFKYHIPNPDPSHITATTPPPSSLKQARRYPDAKEWETAHNAELEKLDVEGAIKWIPDDRIPKHAKVVPLLMKYRYKRTPSGTLLEHKARCTLRGDLMRPNIHYNPDHTAAFMADKATVRMTLALKAAFNLQIDHFDIKSAFVQELYPFQIPVYVKQHRRFDGPFKHQSKAGILIKNIYGGPSGSFYYLRGAEEFLLGIGFSQCPSHPCLFIYANNPREFIVITLNIDDFLVVATSSTLIDQLHKLLNTKYPQRVKRLGPPTQYLGWKIDYLPCGSLKISQTNYIIKALEDAKMTDANGRPSPHVEGVQYHGPSETDKSTPHLTTPFQCILGSLRYITDCTRPDISFYVNRLAQAAHQPTRRHWLIMKNLLRYLKQTLHEGIIYRKLSTPPPRSQLSSYADADFVGDRLDRKSTFGSVHLFNGSPVSWNATKQDTVALSTCEAEYISATTAVQVSLWLHRMLTELHRQPTAPTPLHIDNQAAITVAKHRAPTRKRKCIDVKHHYLQQHLKHGDISLIHVSSSNMLADMFTKPLGPKKFVPLKRKLNKSTLPARPIPQQPSNKPSEATTTIQQTITTPPQKACHYLKASLPFHHEAAWLLNHLCHYLNYSSIQSLRHTTKGQSPTGADRRKSRPGFIISKNKFCSHTLIKFFKFSKI